MIGFNLSLSPVLTQRQEMEMRLEQSLPHKQVQKLELTLYMEREEEFKKLFRQALERDDICQYEKHGLHFQYARVQKQEVPFAAQGLGCGFAHCLYDQWDVLFYGHKVALARGSWLLFVVTDYFHPHDFPAAYAEYVAVHEHGEEVTLGEHDLATRLEFSIAKKERKLTRYLTWLEEQAVEKFTDVFSKQTCLVLPDKEEFLQYLEMKSRQEYAARISDLIQGMEWPAVALRKLNKYARHVSF